MFCPTCGNEVREGLSYCNRCGARQTADSEKNGALLKRSELAARLTNAAGFAGAIGLIALAILIGRLIGRDNIPPPAFILIIVFAAALVGIVRMLLNQVSRLANAEEKPPLPETEKRAERIAEVSHRKLSDGVQAPVSVTEFTTHTLDKVLIAKPNS